MKSALAFTLMALGGLTAEANAQCFGPDNLSGPCWQPTAVNLPAFPDVHMPGKGICWDNCNPSSEVCTDLDITMPIPVSCDQFTAELTVSDCLTGAVELRGKLILDYTRTWNEFDPVIAGGQYQVWRFVAKVDLETPPGIASGCPIPTCLGPTPSAFFYGYMDYALNCSTGQFESALVLFHGCDAFQHDPVLSDRPGAFHPGTSYAIVGPDTSANPFVVAALPATGGAITAEAIRLAAKPSLGGCVNEERIQQGVIQPIGQGCTCTFALAPAQVTARHMAGTGTCVSPVSGPSSFLSLTIGGLPWIETITTSIGTWTTGASYPGPEQVWVDEGIFLFTDGCAAAAGAPSLFGDLMYGASTSQGYFVLGGDDGGGALTDRFTDLASNLAHTVGTPLSFPILGSVRPTDHLIYVNTQ